jgi:hypothetical protein
MASIIHGADIPVDIHITPESAGLRAIAFGYHYLGIDDHEKIELQSTMYDALYAWCQRKAGTMGSLPGRS